MAHHSDSVGGLGSKGSPDRPMPRDYTSFRPVRCGRLGTPCGVGLSWLSTAVAATRFVARCLVGERADMATECRSRTNDSRTRINESLRIRYPTDATTSRSRTASPFHESRALEFLLLPEPTSAEVGHARRPGDSGARVTDGRCRRACPRAGAWQRRACASRYRRRSSPRQSAAS